MNQEARDKVRLHALLKNKRGEAFTATELAQMTGLSEYRVKAAGESLAASSLFTFVEGYYMFKS